MDSSKVRQAFQSTADACGGDILQCCVDCGEEPIITREGLYDYLEMYGGQHGKEVQGWLMDLPGTIKDLEEELDRMGVPKTWI